MIYVEITDRLPASTRPSEGLSKLLVNAAQETLIKTGKQVEASLTILISDDFQLQELNRQYKGIEAPTDVLSFLSDEIDPETGERYLGDVIISYPQAMAQAASGRHSIQEELQLLVVHGVLHLLGYDHADESKKKDMWSLQEAVLKKLGCSIRVP